MSQTGHRAPPALGPGVAPPQAGIAAPGAPGAAEAPVADVGLADYAARGWPDLVRGMVVTVERPWSWRRPLLSLLAWRIRRWSGLIAGRPARASHAMLYLGAGRCASQDARYDVVRLEAYRGCVLRFWAWPGDGGQRNALVAEAVVHVGEAYGWRDIVAQLLRAATGNPAWLQALADRRWICSEAVCALLRTVLPGYLGGRSCDCTPQELEDWMLAQGWPCLALRLI